MLDGANRSFLAFMALVALAGAYAVCGALEKTLAPLVLGQLPDRPLSLLAALPFATLMVASLVFGGLSLARQLIATRRLASRIQAIGEALPDRLAGVALEAHLTGRVTLIDTPELFSFVYGLLTPRVAVSRGLLENTSAAELRAVLEHERYHVTNLDPLKILLTRSLSATFFLLPALSRLRKRYEMHRELAADRRATEICGHRPLAGALLKTMRAPRWYEPSETPIAPVGGSELLSLRVAQLEDEAVPHLDALPSLRSVLLSMLSSALFAAIVLCAISATSDISPSAVGAGLSNTTLIGSVTCAAPFAGAALAAYALIALRARRPLR
jgi:Zn-dependent protease with chaperone function